MYIYLNRVRPSTGSIDASERYDKVIYPGAERIRQRTSPASTATEGRNLLLKIRTDSCQGLPHYVAGYFDHKRIVHSFRQREMLVMNVNPAPYRSRQ